MTKLLSILFAILLWATSAQAGFITQPSSTTGGGFFDPLIIPNKATASLPTAAGSVARVTDGGAIGAITIGDGTDAQCPDYLATGVINWKCPPFNAKGDNLTDDTAAIQAALNRFTDGVTATGSGKLFCPVGTYRITSPLIYGGNTANGIHIEGAVGGTFGPSGCRIDWYGSAFNGAMLIMAGANGSSIDNVEFNSRSLTKYGIHLTAIQSSFLSGTLGTTVTAGSSQVVTPSSMGQITVGTVVNVDTGSDLEYVYVTAADATTFTAYFVKAHNSTAVIGDTTGSSNNTLNRVTVMGIAGTDSAAIALGNATAGGTPQVSEVNMTNMVIRGEATAVSGILTLSEGNTKNFTFTGGTINGFDRAINWASGSGTFTVTGAIIGNSRVADFTAGTGNLVITGGESECVGCKFLTGTTGSNPGSVVSNGFAWQGSAGATDVIIDYTGNISLDGNTFFNDRTGATFPRINVAPDFYFNDANTLFSHGNFYKRAPAGYIPLYSAAGALYWTTYPNMAFNVTSLGDLGGVGGAMVKLKNYVPASKIVSTASSVAGTGILNVGSAETAVAFRNNADDGDVPGLVKGTDDVVTVGGTAGMKSSTINATTGFTINSVALASTDLSDTTTITRNAAALTSTAFTTGGGTTALQTPSATSTLDASGNAIFAGTVGADGFSSGGVTGGCTAGTAGCDEWTQGTAQSATLAANKIRAYAPTGVTSYKRVRPGAAATGTYYWTSDGGSPPIVTESIVAPSAYVPLTERGAATIALEAIVTDMEKEYWATVTTATTDALDFSLPVVASMIGITTMTVRLVGVSKNAAPANHFDFTCSIKAYRPGTDTYTAHDVTGEVAVVLTPAVQYRPVAATSAPLTISGTIAAGGEIKASCEMDGATTGGAQIADFRVKAAAYLTW